MHGFIAIVSGRTVYVEVPHWPGSQEGFPGWPSLARDKALADGLITEDEWKDVFFQPSAPPTKPKPVWR